MRASRPLRTATALGLMLAGAVAAGSWAQDPLTIDDIRVEEPLSPLLALEKRLIDAEATHSRTGDDSWAITEMTAVLGELKALAQRSAEARALAARAYFGRARAHFNLGNIAEVDRDFESLLRAEPGFQSPPGTPGDLEGLLQQVRHDRIGFVELALDPDDARVFIDDREVFPQAGRVALYRGAYQLRAERLGCRGLTDRLEVVAGETVQHPLSLVRESAVLRLQTSPANAQIVIDGRPVAVSGAADAGPNVTVLIPGLAEGRHAVEVRKAGFRTYRTTVEVLQLADYDLGVVALENEMGTIRLRGLPAGAAVLLDGVTTSLQMTGPTTGVLSLPPGDYVILVDQGAAGIFERRVPLADRDELDLEVTLHKPLALLGILSGDELQSDRLRESLLQAGGELGQWALLDRSDAAARVLQSAGVVAATLRTVARDGMAQRPPDWNAVAEAAEGLAPGPAYLIAVLDDDLYASEVDLWWVPARSVMSPARPFRQRLALDDSEGIRAALTDFDSPIVVERPWLGALLIDSGVASGPVVMSVTPGSPAAAGDLKPGDEVLSVWNQQVSTAAQVQAVLARLEPGFELGVLVRRPTGQERQLTVRLGSSPAVFEANNPTLNHVALLANLTGEGPVGGNAPEWLRHLNLANVQMWTHAWDPAVRVLKRVQAETGPGLGQAAADYWLARSLLAVGPRFTEQARAKLEAALAVPDARLYHHDGPLVAPRARALLAALDARR